MWAILLYSIILGLAGNCKKIQIKCLILCAGILLLICNPNRWRLIFEYVYFLIGYGIHFLDRQHMDSVLQKRKLVKLIMIVSFVLLIIYCLQVKFIRLDFSELVYSVISRDKKEIITAICRLFGGYIISATVCFSIYYIVFVTNCDLVAKVFSYLGKISLQIYLLQRIIVELIFADVIKLYGNSIYCLGNVGNTLVAIILSVFFLLLIVGITWLAKQLRISKYIFGR